MRRPILNVLLALAVASLFPLIPCPTHAASHAVPPVKDADSFPAVAVHPEEKIAIAADPYDTKQKMALFRLDYLQYGFMPIRIIVTNNSDQTISLAQAHIDFITAAGDKIETSEVPDVERRAGKIERPDSGYKLPGPLPRIGGKSDTKNKAIEQDFQTFEYSAASVAPHTTQAGFLFYDVQGIANPLEGAKLSLTGLQGANGQELFFFEIPFDKYLRGGASR